MFHLTSVILLLAAASSTCVSAYSPLNAHHHRLLKRLAIRDAPAGICPPSLGSSPITYSVKTSYSADMNGTTNWSGLTSPVQLRNLTAIRTPFVRQTALLPPKAMQWYFSTEMGTGSYTLSSALSKAHMQCLRGTGASKPAAITSCANSTGPVYDYALPFFTLCESCSTTGGKNCLLISDEYGGCLNYDGSSSVALAGCDWSKSGNLWTISAV